MHIYCITFTIILIFQCQPSNQRELVVSKNDLAHEPSKTDVSSDSVPRIQEFLVKTNVANRFAETSIVSKVKNTDTIPIQTSFSVVLPERAYISGFFMEVNGKYHNAFVKEKEEAKKIFGQSVAKGQTAAHVAVSTRNSNRFTIHVNVEPNSKVVFHLAYQELLQRVNGQYEIITNIQPGQVVEKLDVQVTINETHSLKSVGTPFLRPGSNTLVQHNTNLDPHANVTFVGNSSMIVHFQPDIKKQMEFACNGLGNPEYDGFAGQFVVKYDIERSDEGGETLFQDGFFLHFSAPKNMKPLPKHIVFILDTSGSMEEQQKIIQLKDAMRKILPQLHEDDLFSIVQFEKMVYVWNLDSRKSVITWTDPENADYGRLDKHLVNMNLPRAHPATKKNVDKAINMINLLRAYGGSNSIGALEVGLFLIKQTQEKMNYPFEPIMVFLTDGKPSIGSSSSADIIYKTGKLNKAGNNTPIYTLSFGDDADLKFLETLSLQNDGKLTKIQVAAQTQDVSEQLRYFYSTISVPLLGDVRFENLPQGAQTTRTKFTIYFNGSELVVAGRGMPPNTIRPLSISGKGKDGSVNLEATLGIPLTRLEKVWAYLTVKQLAEEYHATGNKTISKIALDLALNYSLVTEFTSLVVVKPDGTSNTIEPEDALEGIFPAEPNKLSICNNSTVMAEWVETIKREFDLERRTEIMTTTTPKVTTEEKKLQIVVMSDRKDEKILPEEFETVRDGMEDQLLQTMEGPEGGPRGPTLQFENITIVAPGWFLITTKDQTSLEWLLKGWIPPTINGTAFRAVQSADAPWPVMIGFWIRSQKVDIPRLIQWLSLQNLSLNVSGWMPQETVGKAGEWFVTFMVSQKTARALDEQGMYVYYKLGKITVHRVPPGSMPSFPEKSGSPSVNTDKEQPPAQ